MWRWRGDCWRRRTCRLWVPGNAWSLTLRSLLGARRIAAVGEAVRSGKRAISAVSYRGLIDKALSATLDHANRRRGRRWRHWRCWRWAVSTANIPDLGAAELAPCL